MTDGSIYEVRTDLPPDQVTGVALEIFKAWMDFALGKSVVGGRRIMYPTGRMAAALQYRQEGIATVAIIMDESIAPEAGILETGHKAIDLKQKLQPGTYPMHRASGAGPLGMRPSVWAEARRRSGTGYASIGPNSAPDSWIIPPMPAYSIALAFAEQAKRLAGEM